MPRPRKFAAWLGLLAIWLTIAMPMAAQWRLYQASLTAAEICSTAHAPASPQDMPVSHGLDSAACGYCSLLAHTPFVESGMQAQLASVYADAQEPPARKTPPPPKARYRLAHPRGPPALA